MRKINVYNGCTIHKLCTKDRVLSVYTLQKDVLLWAITARSGRGASSPLKPRIHLKMNSKQHKRDTVYSRNKRIVSLEVIVVWKGKQGERVKTRKRKRKKRGGAMRGSSTQKGCQDSRRSGKGTKENDGRWEEDQRPGWQDDEWSRQFNLGLLKIASYLPVMGSNYCLFVCSAINVLCCMLLVKALELHSNSNYIFCPWWEAKGSHSKPTGMKLRHFGLLIRSNP